MLIAICAVVAASLPLALPADATTPGRNGRITFMEQDAAGFWQVWVANADLSGQKQLTHGAANSGWPVWSPDGKKIAFDTDRGDVDPNNDPAINDIFTMNTDGSGLRNLTGSKGFSADGSGDPVWSPDGTKILFLHASTKNGKFFIGLATMKPDGSSIRYLTSTSAQQHQPDWQSIRF